jgi:hypothetical protein
VCSFAPLAVTVVLGGGIRILFSSLALAAAFDVVIPEEYLVFGNNVMLPTVIPFDFGAIANGFTDFGTTVAVDFGTVVAADFGTVVAADFGTVTVGRLPVLLVIELRCDIFSIVFLSSL